MWGFVHTFPDGYRPQPTVTLQRQEARGKPSKDVVVGAIETATVDGRERIVKVVVESGTIATVNVPLPPESVKAVTQPGGSERMVVQQEVTLPATVPLGGKEAELRVLAPEVLRAGTQKAEKFGADKVAVVLKPGVLVAASNVVHYFAPAEFNPAHAKYIARSEKAKPMAVNVYSSVLDAAGFLDGDGRRELVHQAQARSRAQEPGLRLDPDPRRRAVPVVSQPQALGRDRAGRADCPQRHLLVRG